MLKLSAFRDVVKRLLGEGVKPLDSFVDDESLHDAPLGAGGKAKSQIAAGAAIAEILSSQRALASGKLHMINLDGLKGRFGDQWGAKMDP